MRRLLLLLSVLLPLEGLAQAWPSKPIRIVVPYPPGGSTDLVARLSSVKMATALGQPIVVENRAGGNSVIGAEMVMRAAPDGYTLMITTPATLTQVPPMSVKPPYDPERDFTPITAALTQSSCLVATPSLGVTTFPQFVDYAKRNPGKLSYGTAGLASAFHLAGEVIKQAAGIDMVHVPYKGGAPVIQAVVAGEVPAALLSNTSTIAAYKAGKVRVLAVLGKKRLKDWPEIPSINEFLPDFDKPGEWIGFYGPGRLPRPIVDRLRTEMLAAVKDPDVSAKLEAFGLQYFGNTPEEFAALMKHDLELNRKLLALAGVKPE
jgi:tripartite-type tricarboxylate transporter receptor subunit TctC